MKKTLSIVAALFALLAVSCTQENLENPAAGKEVTVTFCAAVPGSIATKADDYDYSDGTTAKKLHYGVYVTGETTPRFQSSTNFNSKLEAVVNLTLATGLSYDFVFWAQAEDTEVYSINWETRQMTVDYAKTKSNDEKNDAFYAYVPALQIKGAVNRTIELFRPFAQINLGTNDYEPAATAGLVVDRTDMVVAELPNILNFVDGTVEGKVKATFAINDFDRTEKYPVEGYEYLGMNYILAGTQKTTTELLVFNVWEPEETGKVLPRDPSIEVVNVPYQRNYQTNIYGSLLTDPTKFTVVIKPKYDEPDFDVPADASALYAAAKNGGSVVLESDIELTGTLLVASGKELTVDLNGHTLTAAGGNDVIRTEAGAKVNLRGKGNVTAQDGTGAYAVWADGEGAEINIYDGVYTVGLDADGLPNSAVYAKGNAAVNIYGGTFQVVTTGTCTEYAGGEAHYLINEKDNDGTITIYGGTYVGFNPADNLAEGANTSFVAEGYESVKRKDADIYDVKVKVGNAVVTVTTAAELRTMLNTLTDSGSGDNKIIINANIELAEGENWEPVKIEGYTGAGLITIEGNGHHISGLNAPLFASGFAGKSGLVVKDLTIKNSVMQHVVGDRSMAGIFFGGCDSMESIEFYNCHADNVTLSGDDYVGGFIGYITGYSNAADGPVLTDCVIDGCSITNCKFTAGGSVGALIGHAGGDYNTIIDITNCTVSGCTLEQTEGNLKKLGWAIGTVGAGQATRISGVKGNGNTSGASGAALEVKIGRYAPAGAPEGKPAPYLKVDDTTYSVYTENIY